MSTFPGLGSGVQIGNRYRYTGLVACWLPTCLSVCLSVVLGLDFAAICDAASAAKARV